MRSIGFVGIFCGIFAFMILFSDSENTATIPNSRDNYFDGPVLHQIKRDAAGEIIEVRSTFETLDDYGTKINESIIYFVKDATNAEKLPKKCEDITPENLSGDGYSIPQRILKCTEIEWISRNSDTGKSLISSFNDGPNKKKP